MATTAKDLLAWAVAEVIDVENLGARLASKKKLIVKLGVDPTSPDLHLGHAVVLRKLRQFQDLGHLAVLVIGDFTAGIGDPSGRNQSRPVASSAEIKANLQTYIEQAGLILDIKKAKIVHNSDWLGVMKLADFLGIAQVVSANNLLERQDFADRLAASQSLGLHELLYPICQAIDSVELKADVELGGVDQRLNLLMGRELQKKLGQPPQDIVILKTLVGLDGVKKMSKSLHNYIGLTDSADEMFGKVMSIPDIRIAQYAELAALIGTPSQIEEEFKKMPLHLNYRDQKALVAQTVVALYHGSKAAEIAVANFNQTFRDKKVADHLVADLSFNQSTVQLLEAVTAAAEVSRSQAQRLIEQKAVHVDGQVVDEINHSINLTPDGVLLQVGKHIWRKLRRRV